MGITYIQPLSRAWGRMTKALFRPFDIGKWFVVGFTAFLAGLTDWNGGGSGDGRNGNVDFGEVLDFPFVAWEWLLDNPGWLTLIVFGMAMLTAIIILLTWLSSRGKFMFLDNVVHDRAKVTQPWYEFRALGNSLFLWRLCFGLICFLLFITFLVFCFFFLLSLYESHSPRQVIILSLIGMVFMALSMIITIGFISLFLNDFVVPIMYKNKLVILTAWKRFLLLFSRHILHFLLYGILVFFLHIFVVVCVVVVGLMTCCMGFLFLLIPYIGSVITLPISYTLRAFSLEFLEQFGPEFTLFPKSEETSVPNPV